MSKSDKTKKKIIKALKEIMKKKSLQKITIRELTEKANINRQTFYYHFQDIYECIKWMYQEEAINMLERKKGVAIWQDGMLELFNYIDENREVALCVLKSLGRDSLKNFFFDDVKKICYDFIESLKFDTNSNALIKENQEYIDFLSHYYTLCFASLLESYLLGEINKKPKDLIALIDTLLKDHLSGAFQRLNMEKID